MKTKKGRGLLVLCTFLYEKGFFLFLLFDHKERRGYERQELLRFKDPTHPEMYPILGLATYSFLYVLPNLMTFAEYD